MVGLTEAAARELAYLRVRVNRGVRQRYSTGADPHGDNRGHAPGHLGGKARRDSDGPSR